MNTKRAIYDQMMSEIDKSRKTAMENLKYAERVSDLIDELYRAYGIKDNCKTDYKPDKPLMSVIYRNPNPKKTYSNFKSPLRVTKV